MEFACKAEEPPLFAWFGTKLVDTEHELHTNICVYIHGNDNESSIQSSVRNQRDTLQHAVAKTTSQVLTGKTRIRIQNSWKERQSFTLRPRIFNVLLPFKSVVLNTSTSTGKLKHVLSRQPPQAYFVQSDLNQDVSSNVRSGWSVLPLGDAGHTISFNGLPSSQMDTQSRFLYAMKTRVRK
ncbi:hypothetical protein ABKN59_002205 [Abortiporus biennis]